jgi:hypothetical protein
MTRLGSYSGVRVVREFLNFRMKKSEKGDIIHMYCLDYHPNIFIFLLELF